MAPFDELPIPHVDPVTRVGAVQRGQRVRAVQVAAGALPPAGQGLLAAWQQRRNRRGPRPGPEEAPAAAEEGAAPVPEVDPPETYDAHGERLHPHDGGAAAEGARLDLEA